MRIACVAFEDINLGFGYLISYLKSQKHEVRLFFDPKQFRRAYARIDLLARLLSVENYNIREMKKFKPDICLFTAITATYQDALHMAERVKKEIGCKVIFGGVHPTLVPEVVRQNKFIDEVVERDGVKYFGGEFDPDKIFPDREIFLNELPPEHRKVQLFMTSIGCPFNCSYCGNQQLREIGAFKYIRRSVKGCIEELKQIKERGAKLILFADDIFTMDKKWFNDFIPAYIKEIGLPYTCFIHPRFINAEIVKMLKESGCQSCWLGIQQGDERIRMQIMNRPETNKEIIACAKLVKDAGMVFIIDHIFGVPFENEMAQEISIQLYKEIKPDIVNCYELLYFPKAKIIQHALRCGYLAPSDIPIINQGRGIIYTTNNRGQKFYDVYLKSFITIPLGGHLIWEFLPIMVIKIIILLKAKRAFTLIAILENELFFTWRAILKKTGLYGIFRKDLR